jgi:hypothetical protein
MRKKFLLKRSQSPLEEKPEKMQILIVPNFVTSGHVWHSRFEENVRDGSWIAGVPHSPLIAQDQTRIFPHWRHAIKKS